jgi:hypothetical protein
VDDLPSAAASLEGPLVVVTSHALAYFTAEKREAFVSALAELAASRPLWWVSEEFYGAGLEVVLPDRPDLDGADGLATLGVVRWDGEKPEAHALARTAPHGQRMTWLPL